MRTKIGVFAAHLVESGWLAALVAVPIFFNVYTVRIFEEEKIPLLRSIALVVLGALIVRVAEDRSPRDSLGALWRTPLAKPALVLAAAAVLSNCFSLRPDVSFWGGYVRSQGTYTLFCYLAIFAALVVVLRRREQVERLVTIALLASVPPALYAIVQRLGSDPIGWLNAEVERSTSTAGNAIFVAAFLIMVVPIAIARCLELRERLHALALDAPARRSTQWRLALHAGVLAIQLTAIAATESRGPIAGLAVGLIVFALVWSARAGQREIGTAAVALAAGLALFLVVFNLPNGPLAPLREVPYIGRFGMLTQARFNSLSVRLVVWRASVDLLRSEPLRAVTGYGADTLYLAYRPILPPELARAQGGGVIPDRAHNAIYDALLTAGVLGLAAELAAVLGAILVALRGLGLSAKGGATRLAFFLLGGGVGGAVLACLADARARLAGPGFGLGIAAALLLHLIVVGRRGAPAAGSCASPLLLTGVLAAIVAHFVEIQFGIPVAATRLYFWTYAGLAVALAVPLVREANGEREEIGDGTAQPWLGGDMVSVIPMVGLVLVVLCANFHRQTLAIARHAAALVPLFGGFWIAGAAFVAVEPGFERERLPRLATYAATTLGLCLLFLALYDRWTVPRGLAGGGTIENVMLMASFSARRIAIIHGFVLSVVALFAAIAFAREDQSALPLCRRPLARLVGYAALVPAVVLAVNATNVSGSRADTISKLAINYEASGKLTWAAALQEEALALRPWEDRYALELGSIWLQQAERDGAESAEQTTDLEHAREAFERAARTSPLDPDHSRNLAKLHRFWAKVAANGDERRNHLRAADEEYRRAAVLVPLNPFYRAEWATFFLENGDGSRALELLDEAEALDPQYTTTYWLRANLRAGRGELDEAVAEYDRALAIDPTMMASLSGKALALARLDRLDEAIEVCEDALEIDRHDPVSWSNLVTLLRQKGDTAGALDRAEAALKAVRKKYRPTFEEMIAQLR